MGVGHTELCYISQDSQTLYYMHLVEHTKELTSIYSVQTLLKRSVRTHYSTGATAHSNAYFGEGSGLVHLDSVQCSGLEYSLTDCETMNSGIESSHSLGVGVKCEPGMYYIKVCTVA